jgi:Tfp pilus assembly protein PilX/DNA uptake protein ComE-like DNA-binding protein
MIDIENKICSSRQKSGAALVLTIVVLVILTAIVWRVSSAISQWKYRLQYTIDYQNARYAAESGIKYALATIGDTEPNYVSRPNEPDFSDLFTMSDEEYKLMMEQWAAELGTTFDANSISKNGFSATKMNVGSSSNDNNTPSNMMTDIESRYSSGDINDTNGLNGYFAGMSHDANDSNDVNDANTQNLYVRGPYGPQWPYITKPVELEFGDTKVTIEIIDENAKLPLVWGISSDANAKTETKAAIVTFCEWMQMERSDIEPLQKELDDIKEIKPFSVELKPVVTVSTQSGDANNAPRTDRVRSRRTSRRASNRKSKTQTVQQTRPQIGHTMDFAKIMHSPMIDLETLAKPVNQDETRSESALKYISLWGTDKVNINTAQRNVLEAAFTFGGDAVQIADAIIKERRVEPFKDVDSISKRLMSYTSSIDKCKPYITAQSDFFSIRVKATSGTAVVCATAGIKKEGGKFQKIGIIIE